MLVAGSALIGVSTVFLFRRVIPVLVTTGLSVAFGFLLLWIAIRTPNGWQVGPARGMVQAAAAFSGDPGAVEAASSRALELPVEILETTVDRQPGWVSKEGFSFHLRRRPAVVTVAATFAAGPASSLSFEIVERDGKWVPAPRPAARASGMTFGGAAFERRFPSVGLIEVGGQGSRAPGALLLVRAARAATDWDLVLFRVASNGKVLDEVDRLGRTEISQGFQKAVSERGLGQLGEVFMHYQPSGFNPVLFLSEPEFRFFARLDHSAFRSVALFARLRDGRVSFEIDRPFAR